MKKQYFSVFVTSLLSVYSCVAFAGNEGNELVKKFSDLSNKWYLVSYDMNTYEGLKRYCRDAEFRTHVIDILNEIHKYDSLLYDRILYKAEADGTNHEIKKTLKQIEEFEKKYKADSFSKKLKDECLGQRQLEKNYDEIKNDIGENSYDSQVLILEADLKKYVRHISKLMDHIKEHIHHLHIE